MPDRRPDPDDGSDRLPRPPAHVEPYVRVLGHEGAVEFLLTFGGAELYLATNPKGRSALAKLVGIEKATELARVAEERSLPRRVPTAKPWIAQVLRANSLPVAEIARKLHVTDVTVRRYVQSRPDDDRQLPLF